MRVEARKIVLDLGSVYGIQVQGKSYERTGDIQTAYLLKESLGLEPIHYGCLCISFSSLFCLDFLNKFRLDYNSVFAINYESSSPPLSSHLSSVLL